MNNGAHSRTAPLVGRRCRDAQTAAKTSEAMFLLVRSLTHLLSPTLRSRQSSSFALPESGAVSSCAHEQPKCEFIPSPRKAGKGTGRGDLRKRATSPRPSPPSVTAERGKKCIRQTWKLSSAGRLVGRAVPCAPLVQMPANHGTPCPHNPFNTSINCRRRP
jgi:hypothetical protein